MLRPNPTHGDLITSQRPRLLMLPPWELGLKLRMGAGRGREGTHTFRTQ